MTPTQSIAEIIAFSSGKGGTGKTLIAACLGYALTRSGHRVLMIDGDPGTDGLSLFLLGRHGMEQINEFSAESTFSGVLRACKLDGNLKVSPRTINRSVPGDHGVIYNALISGPGLYGDVDQSGDGLAVPDLSHAEFQSCMTKLLATVRDSGNYDYILVDTRGGFSFESTDVCALADSFIVVTESDYTSFYQDRNLVKRISISAAAIGRRPLLRAVIVNKATEGIQAEGMLDLDKIEHSFRLALEREFPIKYRETYAVPLDLEAVKSYKTQNIPYLVAPASPFSFATLSAFSDILRVVTAQWPGEQIAKWNELVDGVSKEIKKRNQEEKNRQDQQESALRTLGNLAADRERLETELDRAKKDLERQERQYEREIERSQLYLGSVASDQKTTVKSSKPPRLDVAKRYWQVLSFLSLLLAGGLLFFLWFKSTALTQAQLVTMLYSPTSTGEGRVSAFRELMGSRKAFSGVDLSGADLSGLDLRSTDFRRANMIGVHFQGTQLDQADFSLANLTGVDLARASTNGTNLVGADLRGSNLTPVQLGMAKTDATTLLPSALTTPNSANQPGTYIQLITTTRAKADSLSEQLRKNGFATITTPNPKDESLVRVLVGPVSTEKLASTLEALAAVGYTGMLVRTDLTSW